jgi:bleomycin hydrolase
MVKEQGLWDEGRVVAVARLILDAHMGPPPVDFEWEGREYTPRKFLDKVLELKMGDYVNVVSRMDTPFHQYGLLDVTDNWRRSETYLNLPLDTFSTVIRKAVKAGYTVDIGGDNSEPGLDGKMDAAVIPAWDIPADYIDQGSREFRIVNETTTDDHGIHIVGYTRLDDREWYLIKDSNRSSRLGHYKGYYFFDANYVKLKMLSFMVHKDMLEGLLPE